MLKVLRVFIQSFKNKEVYHFVEHISYAFCIGSAKTQKLCLVDAVLPIFVRERKGIHANGLPFTAV